MSIFKLINDKVEITEEYVKIHKWNGECFIKVLSPMPLVSLEEEKFKDGEKDKSK